MALAPTMPGTMVRQDEATRITRSYRNDNMDESREPNDTFRVVGESFYPSQTPSSYDPSIRDEDTSQAIKVRADTRLLTVDETIELAKNAVESGLQDTQRSLAGSEAVSEAVRPKLTIDLGHSNIARIPEPVVDLIKNGVERYVDHT